MTDSTDQGGALPHERIELEDIGSNPAPRETIGELVERRLSRRAALRGLLGAGAAAGFSGQLLASVSPAAQTAAPQAGQGGTSLSFREIAHQMTERDAVPEGYEIQTVIRWGDAVLPDAPAFDPQHQSAGAQAMQFGYNNDFIEFFPLPQGSRSADHGLLTVNHEYTDPHLMFPGLAEEERIRRGRTRRGSRR
ncbi:alkaline phosphatase PhoX [Pseudoroseomonas cervicalis]|uniref:alkaline phosphatase PhoX n=1 Tax=Teichococcus cervicalis TaxID=204525 RepID=UPI0035EFC313